MPPYKSVPVSLADNLLTRELGTLLRKRREELNWARDTLGEMLTPALSSRAVNTYEVAARKLTIARYVQMCRALSLSPDGLLRQAAVNVNDFPILSLTVDIVKLADGTNCRFEPVHQWARNRLKNTRQRSVSITPSEAATLATVIGCRHHMLALYLAEFLYTWESASVDE